MFLVVSGLRPVTEGHGREGELTERTSIKDP
jgi:hypothetical protein